MIDYSGKRALFGHPRKRSNPIWIFTLLLLILAGLFVIQAVRSGRIAPFLQVVPTPTRSLNSYVQEGETHFQAGNLEKAIEAYRYAIAIDPEDADLRAELARIQVYSTSQITVDARKRERLEEALATIEEGLAISPQNSNLYAVKAFALDWYGSSGAAGEASQEYLVKGEQAATEALQYDNTNALALAYYAELLIDQLKYSQAQQYITQALERDDTLMDVHRVNGNVQEASANYTQAIEEYKKAIQITPNLNFLYLSLGANYRQLANMTGITTEQNYYFGLALEAFAKAVAINDQLGVRDPIPLISIANTYVQQGEFFAAARNMLRAVAFAPDDPTAYGQLGVVYYKSRNYEGSILPLRCAVRGCSAAESCLVRNGGLECAAESIPDIPIHGLELTNNSVVYYYHLGSVLAGLHQPNNHYCDEAMTVFDEIRAKFANDETIMGIVREGETICGFYGYH
ncbi:MAG TPA: tetratricopeptide repeat protein [Anaerolineaceae bacterium]|nr:tetratricopeptide repeat protein [Anaerolineaceae bacterium]